MTDFLFFTYGCEVCSPFDPQGRCQVCTFSYCRLHAADLREKNYYDKLCHNLRCKLSEPIKQLFAPLFCSTRVLDHSI